MKNAFYFGICPLAAIVFGFPLLLKALLWWCGVLGLGGEAF